MVLHQRLYFKYPTFIERKWGIGKTEILSYLQEIYSFGNQIL
jgi:hypothetical protein